MDAATPARPGGLAANDPVATRLGVVATSAPAQRRLLVAIGQHSEAGAKAANQDFHGAWVPREPQLSSKGVAIAIADGISSSAQSQHASQAAVTSFLEDYYCTSEAWAVKHAVERVLGAANSWLYGQTMQGLGRDDRDRGWVCTFSAVVVKSRTAHLFHVGDTRIYQVQGRTLEPLTTDHRVYAGGGQSYLGRALGTGAQLEIDYRAVPLEEGDTFVLATDGVYEHVAPRAIAALIEQHAGDLDAAALAIVQAALAGGSPDNCTVQVVRIDALPPGAASEASRQAGELPLPPLLAPRMVFDGWRIERELHGSSRSHVYLAQDEATGETAVLKTPAVDLSSDPAYLERFLLEEWVARRVSSAHLLQARLPQRRRQYLYTVMEYIEGRTLTQWMVDQPRPTLEIVRCVVEQVARGLRALHRLDMVHQDLRPENVMVDRLGTVKIIDFGATQVAGIAEMQDEAGDVLPPGTAQYMAPEAFLGHGGSPAGDLFSLAVIAYQLLTGRLPYGLEVVKCRTLAEQKRLRYEPVTALRPDVPTWVDEALRKALNPEPHRRYADVLEFVEALRRPDSSLPVRQRVPLLERNPVVFWKGLSLVLAVGWVVTLGLRGVGN